MVDLRLGQGEHGAQLADRLRLSHATVAPMEHVALHEGQARCLCREDARGAEIARSSLN